MEMSIGWILQQQQWTDEEGDSISDKSEAFDSFTFAVCPFIRARASIRLGDFLKGEFLSSLSAGGYIG